MRIALGRRLDAAHNGSNANGRTTPVMRVEFSPQSEVLLAADLSSPRHNPKYSETNTPWEKNLSTLTSLPVHPHAVREGFEHGSLGGSERHLQLTAQAIHVAPPVEDRAG